MREDLGLDALDILVVDERLIAFSTELDSPHGNFGAGDLLFTNGASIPNAALLFRFDIPLDLGLDGVHFVGRPDGIRRFLEVVGGTAPQDWLGGKLQDVLTELDIDIWFSVEGSWWRVEGQRPCWTRYSVGAQRRAGVVARGPARPADPRRVADRSA